MIHNHYGYGLRNDEKPFAHKIPSGGNWKCLSREDQIAFMKGAINSGGGQTTFLRRMSWDEPALTINASPMAKATCYLHPGEIEIDKGDDILKPLLDSIPSSPPNGLTAVEFFAGGGLQSLGVKHAGINIIKAYDNDKNAVHAYRYNLGDYIELVDINKLAYDEIPNTDIYVMSPPCQSWSLAGNQLGIHDPRGQLMMRSIDILLHKRPKAFWIENVKGMLSKKFAPVFDEFIRLLEQEYNVTYRLLNAWDYGVAQKRERVFIVGIRKDLGITYEFPPSEYETTGYRPVLRDAIGDLPEPGYREERQPIQGEAMPNHSPMIKRPHLAEMPYSNPHPSTAKAPMDKAAYTLCSGHMTQPIHPTQKPRRFTVRECLRIQSVPDTYIFPDDMSLSAMYRVVGNGVPSRLAYHVAKSLSEQLLHIGRA